MTNIEMWNMTTMGYAPMRLLLGTSVYSLGIVGSVTSALKTFVRGEINELTRLIYDARENALAIINNEAKENWGRRCSRRKNICLSTCNIILVLTYAAY